MSLGKVKNYQAVLAMNRLRGNPIDADLFYDDPGATIEFSNACGCENKSNAGGYGFWISKSAAEAKKKAGIPPLGGRRAAKLADAKSREQAIKDAGKPDTTTKQALDALGKSVSSGKSAASTKKDNTIYYVGGAVLLVGVIAFFVMKKKNKSK